MKHTYDHKTFFCTRCGAAAQDAINKNLQCIAEKTNVVAVSHIIARKRMSELLGETVKPFR